jgi:hypothetical protein
VAPMRQAGRGFGGVMHRVYINAGMIAEGYMPCTHTL